MAQRELMVMMSAFSSVLSLVPDLTSILMEANRWHSYYPDLVAREIKHMDEAVVMQTDDAHIHDLEIALQEEGIPFIVIPGKQVENKFGNPSAGSYLGFVRTIDEERAYAVSEKLKEKFRELGLDLDMDEAFELDRTLGEKGTTGDDEEPREEGAAPETGAEEEEGADQDGGEGCPEKKKAKTKKSPRREARREEAGHETHPAPKAEEEKAYKTAAPEEGGRRHSFGTEEKKSYDERKKAYESEDIVTKGTTSTEDTDPYRGEEGKERKEHTGTRTGEGTPHEERRGIGPTIIGDGNTLKEEARETAGAGQKELKGNLEKVRVLSYHVRIEMEPGGDGKCLLGQEQMAGLTGRAGKIWEEKGLTGNRGQNPGGTERTAGAGNPDPSGHGGYGAEASKTGGPTGLHDGPYRSPFAAGTRTSFQKFTDDVYRLRAKIKGRLRNGGDGLPGGPVDEEKKAYYKAARQAGMKNVRAAESIYRSRMAYKAAGLLNPGHTKMLRRSLQKYAGKVILQPNEENPGGNTAYKAMLIISPATTAACMTILKAGAIDIANRQTLSTNGMKAMLVAMKTPEDKAKKMVDSLMANERAFLFGENGNLLKEADINSFLGTEEGKSLREALRLQEGQTLAEFFASNRLDQESFIKMFEAGGCSSGLIEEIKKIPFEKLSLSDIQNLLRKYGMNAADKEVLDVLLAMKLRTNPFVALGGSFLKGFESSFRAGARQFMRGEPSEAASGFYDVTGYLGQWYGTARAGWKLAVAIASNMKRPGGNSLLSEETKKALKSPLKHTFESIGKRLAKTPVGKTRVATWVTKIWHDKFAPVKFLLKPVTGGFKLVSEKFAATAAGKAATTAMGAAKTVFGKTVGAAAGAVSNAVADIAVVLGWIFVAVLILIIIVQCYAMIQEAEIENSQSEGKASNYVFVQDTEILQEIVTELQAKNDKFMADINDAAHHRGAFSTTANLTTDEDVGYYSEYTIIFQDIAGNQLDAETVDLNNTKDIVSLATKYMPYALTTPGDGADEATVLKYENIKEYFKSYCYMLWSSSHRVEIAEYHPGNDETIDEVAIGEDVEINASGITTNLETGVCRSDGDTMWIYTPDTSDLDFSPFEGCGTCYQPYATGEGDYGYDLCSHGHWEPTANWRYIVICGGGHLHDGQCSWEEDNDGQQYIKHKWANCEEVANENGASGFTRTDNYITQDDVIETLALPTVEETEGTEIGWLTQTAPTATSKGCVDDKDPHIEKITHYHREVQWKYVCEGHMGNVVYVTIGNLSRNPSFPAAKDIDLSMLGEYPSETVINAALDAADETDMGDAVTGSDVLEEVSSDAGE